MKMCNHCGKVIKPEKVGVSSTWSGTTWVTGVPEEVELCKECHEELVGVIRDFVNYGREDSVIPNQAPSKNRTV